MDTFKSLNDINTKVSKVFHNPNINFFIIMSLILLISCYTFINTPLRYAISSFISNPIIILFALILIIVFGYYNINIAIMMLLLLFIAVFGAKIFNKSTSLKQSIENFTDSTDKDNDKHFKKLTRGSNTDNHNSNDNDNDNDDDGNDNDDNDDDDDNDNYDTDTNTPKITKHIKKKTNIQINEEDEKEQDKQVESIKNVILGTVNQFKDIGDNDYKKGLLENKQIIYKNEKQRNNTQSNNTQSNNSNSSSKNNSKKSKHSKEEFQTIKTRAFNPNKEEDTNLLITKEVLQDMINRIEYNFESSTYLKKYLKHRIEEIIELNDLLDENE